MHWGCYYATALDIEVDPQRCCLSGTKTPGNPPRRGVRATGVRVLAPFLEGLDVVRWAVGSLRGTGIGPEPCGTCASRRLGLRNVACCRGRLAAWGLTRVASGRQGRGPGAGLRQRVGPGRPPCACAGAEWARKDVGRGGGRRCIFPAPGSSSPVDSPHDVGLEGLVVVKPAARRRQQQQATGPGRGLGK